MIKHEYNGLIGVAAIAKAYNLNQNTLQTRLSKGWSYEDAVRPVTRKLKKKNQPATTEVTGIRFPDRMSDSWRMALGMTA
ncbi:hypothetical protein L3Q72_19820 [Vibrio sp. JC009]|uniref:hypothetical protein n=1 Tax=Vibrio sp. JC009 TaxID=2912314 RepID=UPI0023B191F8|nr:hypothetical protein [Vibrio sp. JC009]WED23490.1 hypothetical protein L3Q72_19820 [Vibrio sp. JC009]